MLDSEHIIINMNRVTKEMLEMIHGRLISKRSANETSLMNHKTSQISLELSLTRALEKFDDFPVEPFKECNTDMCWRI